MITFEKEIIYGHRIEQILEWYLKNQTNSYPQGCNVNLTVDEDGVIVAEVMPNKSNLSSITYSNNDEQTLI